MTLIIPPTPDDDGEKVIQVTQQQIDSHKNAITPRNRQLVLDCAVLLPSLIENALKAGLCEQQALDIYGKCVEKFSELNSTYPIRTNEGFIRQCFKNALSSALTSPRRRLERSLCSQDPLEAPTSQNPLTVLATGDLIGKIMQIATPTERAFIELASQFESRTEMAIEALRQEGIVSPIQEEIEQKKDAFASTRLRLFHRCIQAGITLEA